MRQPEQGNFHVTHLTLRKRMEALEALMGFVFMGVWTCAAGLVGIFLVAQAVYLGGRQGTWSALGGGAALLAIVGVHWRYVVSFEVDDVARDAGADTARTFAARVRSQPIFARCVTAAWCGMLAAALLWFAHVWAHVFELPGHGPDRWLWSTVGAAILFIGAFASNACWLACLAAVGVHHAVLTALWRHRYVLDATIAMCGMAIGNDWTVGPDLNTLVTR